MDAEGLRGRIELETAELRGAFPALERCESALVQWTSPDAAVEAAFRSVRQRLRLTEARN